MRIVQLANFHAPTSGGLRVAADTLRAGYRAAGHECTLIVPGVRDAALGAVRTLRSPRLGGTGYRVIVRQRAVLALLDELRPDVLEVHDKLLLRWARQWSAQWSRQQWSRQQWSAQRQRSGSRQSARSRAVPVVAWSHERLERTLPMLLPGLPGAALRRGAGRIARATADSCDVLIACSRFAADEFSPHAPVRIVRLGVDLDGFRPPPGPDVAPSPARSSGSSRPDVAPSPARSSGSSRPDVGPISTRTSARAPGPLRLVLAVRLSPEKRPELAVDALRVLHEHGVPVELTVLGAGPRQAALATYADGLPVRFTGYLDGRERVAAELGAADVAFAPAPAETFGLAALEALACGTPIVAHAGAAPAELVARHPGAGEIAAGDAASFAAAALRVAEVPRALRRNAARRAAEAYPWSATIAAMLAIHEELLETPPCRFHRG